jgi:hypothetical protein
MTSARMMAYIHGHCSPAAAMSAYVLNLSFNRGHDYFAKVLEK